jgi:hypothetical protein
MAQGSSGRRLMSANVATVLVTLAIAGASSSLQASARTAHAQPTIATAEDTKLFLGRWTTTFDSPQGAITFDIEVHLDTGDPGATVSNSLIGDAEVTDVTKAGASLVLRYVAEVQGTQVPVSISLVPDGETLKADFSFMDGQYATSSIATRKK